MKNLKLTEEQKHFIDMKEVSKHLKVKEVTKLKSDIDALASNRFNTSVELAKVCYKMKSEMMQKDSTPMMLARQMGVKLNAQFLADLHALSKTYFNRLVKAGENATASNLKGFNKQVDKQIKEGGNATRSIDAFNSWCKDDAVNGGEGETKVKERDGNTIFTLTYKPHGADKGVSVRINGDGDVKTSNSADEIRKAVAFFNEALKGFNEPAPKVWSKQATDELYNKVAEQATKKGKRKSADDVVNTLLASEKWQKDSAEAQALKDIADNL